MEVNKQPYGYFLGIYTYEKNLSIAYNKLVLSKEKDYQGFLIKLSDYDNFKKNICYDDLLKEKNHKKKFSKEDFNNLINKYKLSISNIKKVEQVKIVKKEELIKLIKDGNEYKIIDKNLCDLICAKDKFFSMNYKYILNSHNLRFLDIPFSHRNNILDEFSYEMGNDNKKLITLSKSIIEYLNFEKKFIHNVPFQLNKNNNSDYIDEIKERKNNFNMSRDNIKIRGFSYDKNSNNNSKNSERINREAINKKKEEGFLVNKNWIEDWKNYTNYDKIIKEFSNPTNEDIERIAEKIFYYQKNNNKIKELNPIELIYFNSKDEYENYLKKNNLAIIDINFFKYFNKNQMNSYLKDNNNKINYSFQKGVIKIYSNDTEMDFISIKNCILKKSFVDLIILKYIIEFQELLKSNNLLKKGFTNIVMVEKNWIQELKNKYLYNIYSKEIKKINFHDYNFLANVSKIYLDKIKQKEEKNELDINSKEKIKIMNKEINNRQMKYITDFEIINNEAIPFFKIIYKDFSDYYYEGEYYCSNDTQYSNIIICFRDSIRNYNYQIGKINENNVFITNYVFNLSYNSSLLFENILCNQQREQEFFNLIYFNENNNNEFFIHNNIQCFFSKLNFNDDLDCLKKLFFSINKFENDFNNKIMNHEKIYPYENCYLISKRFWNEFKNTFLYSDYNKIDKQQFFNIFSDKKKYEKIFEYENYLDIVSYTTIKNQQFCYPNNFDVINEEIYIKLNTFAKFLNIKMCRKLFLQTPLIINCNKLIIKIMSFNILIIKIEKNNEYIPELILAFDKFAIKDKYFEKLSENNLNKIIYDEVISFIYNQQNEVIGNKYSLDKLEYNNNNINEQVIKNNLKIILEFYKLNKLITNETSKIITLMPTINAKEVFIVNKKWLDEFNYIFSYDEILNTLEENKYLILKDDIIDIIFNKINDDLKKYLNNLNEDIITTKFNNKNLYNIFNKKYIIDANNEYLYFENSSFVNNHLIDLIKINQQITKAKSIFGDDKILLRTDSMIIIGNLKNNLFFTEYLINLNNNENLTTIENFITIKGFDYINKLLKRNIIFNVKSYFNDIKLITQINNMENTTYDDSQIKNMDEKLKALLILCIYQLKLKSKKYYEKNLKDAYLLNYEFLSQLNYDNLLYLINNFIGSKSNLKSDIESDEIKEREILYKYSKYLNTEIISGNEKNINQLSIQSLESCFYSKPIKLILSDKRNIDVYNNFIIVDKNIINLFKEIFNFNNINTKNIYISHISSNQKNIILINNFNKQNILLGNIMNNGNYFKLEYIFDYFEQNIILSELNKIINNYDEYFKNYINFNGNYENDYISPIFSFNKKDIIGYCYKYNDNIKIDNYINYSLNTNLSNIIQMYIYDSILKNILIKNVANLQLNDYYLVNINFLKEYKEYYNYSEIKKELNTMKDNSTILNNIYDDLLNNNNKIYTTKSFYSLVKFLNPDINLKFNTKKEIKLNERNLRPDLIEINYYDYISQEKEIIKIDNNFELINKNILELFINKNNLGKSFITYEIINDYILINYPKYRNKNNNKNITLIGNLSNENIFNTKYCLIYYSNKRFEHIKFLKKNLNDYLKKVSLINFNVPIINDINEIIGIFINNNNCMDNKNLNKKLKDLEIKYNKEITKNNSLTNKLEETKDLLNKEKNNNLELNNKIKIISSINSKNQSLLDEEKLKNNNLKNTNDQLNKELQSTKLNINELQNRNNKLNNELENEKNNSINLKKEIKELKENLNDETNLKTKLNETIISKESKLSESRLILNELNQKVESLESTIENNENDNKNKIIKLLEELKSKENEIKEIQSRYPVILSEGEKLICLIIMSKDKKISYPIICKANDKFSKIEEIFCEKFPKFNETENIFTLEGQKIYKLKSIESNNIKYGDIITIEQESK